MSVKVMSDKKLAHRTDKLTDNSVLNFVGDIKSEFKKITWTAREELRTYTKIVIGATFVFGLGVYFVDLIVQGCLNGLDTVLRFMVG